MNDRIFIEVGDWALASDGVQWMLLRYKGALHWRALAFVRSTREVLARCMRENGLEAALIAELLSGLPDTFDQWKSLQRPRQRH